MYPARNIYNSPEWKDREKRLGISYPHHALKKKYGLEIVHSGNGFFTDYDEWPSQNTLDHIKKEFPRVDIAQFDKLLIESRPNYLPSNASLTPMLKSPYLKLEQYSKIERGKTISNIKRKIRKSEKEIGPISLTIATDFDKKEWFIDFTQMLQKRQTNKGITPLFELPKARETLSKWILNEELPDWIKPFRFMAGEHTLAMGLFYVWQDIFYYQYPAFNDDMKFIRYSPGLTFVQSLIEWSIEQKLSTFDFGQGNERYKYMWHPEDRILYLCEVPFNFKAKIITSLRSLRGLKKTPLLDQQ